MLPRILPALCLLVFLTACGGGEEGATSASTPAGNLLRVDLDKSNERRLLAYYMGSYHATARDPFASGVLVEDGGRIYLDRDTLAAHAPEVAAAFADANGDAVLDWDEFADAIQATYYTARNFPSTVDGFLAALPEDASPWYTVEVDGVMTQARRRVRVRSSALRSALAGYQEQNQQLLYPVGTAFIGEHWDGETLAETTIMQKRADGFWDYVVYGSDGALATATATEPRALKVPTQCAGCHFGSKLFEPEKSFPAGAPDGPHGPRGIYVDEALQRSDLVTFFQEHARRSDTVLGLYNTLFVAQLLADRDAATLTTEDAALLADLSL